LNVTISIITINYNNLIGLKKTFESVVTQTYKNIQFIVIDGNSSDGSKEFLQRNSLSFDYWVSEPDNGIYNAMNKGIAQAKGKYLLFLNSGDIFCNKDSLNLTNAFTNQEFSLVIFKYFGQQDLNQDIGFYDLWYKTPFSHQAIIFKKDLFSIYGFYNEELRIVADWSFILEVFCNNESTKIVNEKIVITDKYGVSNSEHGIAIAKQERERIYKFKYRFFLKDYTELAYFKESKAHRLTTWFLRKFGKGPKYI
jgi:glycosyltransferase involved in cell wall biosynthesis